MSVISVIPPFSTFPDITGEPINNGAIYIGQSGTNPLISTNQIAVYADVALTIPVAQPILTNGGYPINNGTPIHIYSGVADYSIALLDKNGAYVYSSLSNKTKFGLIDLASDVTGALSAASISYPQTLAEAAALVTPVNLNIPSHDYCGYLNPFRYVNLGTYVAGTTDIVATGLQPCIAIVLAANASGKQGWPIRFPAGAFSFGSAPTFGGATTAMLPIDIGGAGNSTQIINNLPASTSAAFPMAGKNGWYLHDFLICGNSVHKNDGIQTNTLGGAQSIRWRIERVTTMMAGRGIVVEDTNTGRIIDCKNWPDNPPALIVPQTVTSTDIDHGIYLTGGFAHDITILNFDGTSSTAYKAGACGIRCDAAGPNYGIRIIGPLSQSEDLTTDLVNCGIYLTNCDGPQIIGPYFEGATLRFNTVSNMLLSGSGNGGLGGKIFMSSNCINNTIIGNFAKFLDINDSTCINNTIIGNFFSDVTTPINDAAAPNNRYINNKTGAASKYNGADRGGTPWTAVTYSASMTPDMSSGHLHNIVPNNGVAFTINPPINQIDGDTIVIKIRNATGGALGALTWDAQIKAATTTQPANGFSIVRTFTHDKSYGSGILWIQTGADVTVAN